MSSKPEYMAAYYKANAEKLKAQQRQYRIDDPEKIRQQSKALREKNKEKIRLEKQALYYRDVEKTRARKREVYHKNIERINELRRAGKKPIPEDRKQRHLAKLRDSYKQNPYKAYAKSAARRVAQINSIPAWANKFFISEIYELAALRTKMLGIKFEVDHIVPVKSKRVCGLHVENNLQILTKLENRAKGNYSWPCM
jgi:hypothetical protein